LASDARGSARVFSDSSDMVPALRAAADASHRLGNYAEEVEILNELRLLDSVLYSSRNRSEYLRLQLYAYDAAGQYDLARALCQKWKASSAGDSAALSTVCSLWGSVQLANYPDSALRSFSQALGLASSQSD